MGGEKSPETRRWQRKVRLDWVNQEVTEEKVRLTALVTRLTRVTQRQDTNLRAKKHHSADNDTYHNDDEDSSTCLGEVPCSRSS